MIPKTAQAKCTPGLGQVRQGRYGKVGTARTGFGLVIWIDCHGIKLLKHGQWRIQAWEHLPYVTKVHHRNVAH